MTRAVRGSNGNTLRPDDLALLHARIMGWYADEQRDLPWRRADCSAWGVLVSEVMLQQTPVVRVRPVWDDWMQRWPTPADLAAAAAGDAVRHWGRLGYPRRALRLHAAAVAIRDQHHGRVPDDLDELLALPGIGSYTAAAVSAFAFGKRSVVVDTNIRRVHARLVSGQPLPSKSLTAAETALAEELLPMDPAVSATWNVAVMELGALICTAKSPACDQCPVLDLCAWQAKGAPAYDGPPRRGQAWAGTDRQVRGKMLQVLRDADGPVEKLHLDAVWSDVAQRDRCLLNLVHDGLVEPVGDNMFALPQ